MTEYLELNATDCKHCYKCIRNCPVKAIRFSGSQAAIMQQECVLCGRCFVSCPQNAKRVHNSLPDARALVQQGPAFASVAPSFVANYPGLTIHGMKKALLRLGFADAGETAVGATLVKQRYDEMADAEEQNVIVSTCCHTVNMLVQKYYPAVLPHMAHVLSPMQAHCAAAKAENPDIKTVFIGPCISKKAEAEQYPGQVDCVLTFDELNTWLAEEGIPLEEGDDAPAESVGRARLFPTVGGILRTMRCDNPNYHYMAIDGMENCITALEDIAAGGLQNCFIEMSACSGSCVGGPAIGRGAGLVRSVARVNAYAKPEDFAPQPLPAETLLKPLPYAAPPKPHFGEKAVLEVLRKIGKTREEDELNCGSCGYETCREKAQAVLAGKANLEMCLPYLMGKAQSFSDTIIQNTPNGVLVLNEEMEIQQLNRAACQILQVKSEGDVKGRHVVCLMDPQPFLTALGGAPPREQRIYLAEYDRFVKMTVIQDKEYNLVIAIMRDVTETETAKSARREVADKTIRVTDEVIAKQMRTVQEIASLLGETAAETKIALTKLKETLSDE